ncbi:hypothetical protein K503DRAFT_782399, partial [Rhizopogon vinicolor AM-OR11-026]
FKLEHAKNVVMGIVGIWKCSKWRLTDILDDTMQVATSSSSRLLTLLHLASGFLGFVELTKLLIAHDVDQDTNIAPEGFFDDIISYHTTSSAEVESQDVDDGENHWGDVESDEGEIIIVTHRPTQHQNGKDIDNAAHHDQMLILFWRVKSPNLRLVSISVRTAHYLTKYERNT